MDSSRNVSPKPGRTLPALALGALVLGVLAWLAAIATGRLSPVSFPLVLAADLVWWFPLLFYLLRDLPYRRTVIAWAVVVCHLAACLMLLAAGTGTEIEPDMAARQLWVGAHMSLWVATWTCWAVASLSLLAFCVAWTVHLRERGASRKLVLIGCLAVALGLVFDLTGESLNAMWLTRPGISLADFSWGVRLYAVLSAATANGLYCIGGLMLSTVAWRSGWLRGWVGLLGFLMWTVGLGLTLAAILDSGRAMVVTGGGVMVLYIPWAALVGWRFTKTPTGAS